MNLRPSGYEPDELPGCSTPRQLVRVRGRNGREGVERELGVWRAWRRPTLPPLSEAVPWAQRVFTAEFGMGSGVWPLAMATRPGKPPCDVIGWGRKCLGAAWGLALHAGGGAARRWPRRWIKPIRAISTGQLHGLPRFHLRPIDVVVYHGSRRDLVLRRVSRLDAFSGYPVRT